MNIFYFFSEALREIRRHPLSFMITVVIFALPLFLFSFSFFLHREGEEVLKIEREKRGSFLASVNEKADISFLKGEIKSRNAVRGIGVIPVEGDKIVFRIDLSVNLDKGEEIEEIKRGILELEGIGSIKYQGEDIQSLVKTNWVLRNLGIFLGLISSFFVVKYNKSRVKKELCSDKERIEILELCGASSFFTQSPLIARGFIGGMTSGLFVIFLLRLILKQIFLYYDLQFFIHPSTLATIMFGGLLLVSGSYFFTVRKQIK